MCDGNCDACPVQCSASKIIDKFKNKPKEKQEMSEAVGGCHAGNEEKIGRLDERSHFIVERNNSCKWIGIIALLIALGGLFVAWTALRDLDAVKDQIKDLKYNQESLKSYAEDGRRAYDNARQALSRSRKKSL